MVSIFGKQKGKGKGKDEPTPVAPGAPKAPAQPQCQIFGTQLETLVQVYGTAIPGVVRSIIQFLERDGRLDTEGLFMKDNDATQWQLAQELKARFEIEKHVDLKPQFIHAACGLLKIFLSELPDPVLTYDLYDDFINCSRNHQARDENYNEEDAELDTLLELQKAVSLLPQVEKFFLSYMLGFFSKVSARSEQNQLDSEKLGKIFGPLLLFPRESGEERVKETAHLTRIIRILIENYQVVCFSLKSTNVKRKEKTADGAAGPTQPDDPVPQQQIMLPSKVPDDLQVVTVRAVRDYDGENFNDLTFKKGEYIRVLQSNPNGIWQGECEERAGMFPCDFCEVIGVVKKLQFRVNKNLVNPKILQMQAMMKKSQEEKEADEKAKEIAELSKKVNEIPKEFAGKYTIEELEASAPRLTGPKRPAGPVRRLPGNRQPAAAQPERKLRPLGAGFSRAAAPQAASQAAPDTPKKKSSDPEKDALEEKLNETRVKKHSVREELEKLKKALAQEKESQRFSQERVLPDLKADLVEAQANMDKIKSPLEESRKKRQELEAKFEKLSEDLKAKTNELKTNRAKLQQLSVTAQPPKAGSGIGVTQRKKDDDDDDMQFDLGVDKQQQPTMKELRGKFNT